MKKTIDTLIEDIHSSLEDPKHIVSGKAFNEFLDAIKKTIMKAYGPDQDLYLRMSNVGSPDRKLWYEFNSDISKGITAQTRIVFLYGDLIEALLIFMTKEAGHKVTEQQKKVEINGVKGSKDCDIDGELVDIKSASAFNFTKFKTGSILQNDPFGYIPQLSSYAEADGRDRAYFFVINKANGEMCTLKVEGFELINAKERIDHIRRVIKSKDKPIEKCYKPVPDGKSGNMKLAFECGWCPYKYDCWKDTNHGLGIRRFQYSDSVRELVEIGKMPKVEEISV